MEWFGQIKETSEWLRSFGIWAIFVSLILSIIISLMGVVLSLFLSGANAAVFGIVPGFFISLAGEVIGAGISFWLYRWGYKKVSKKSDAQWKWLQRLNGAGRRKQGVILLVARMTPVLPSGVITFGAAASTMLFIDFMIITVIGKAPSVAMETLIGHDLLFLNDNMPRLIISILLLGLLLILFRPRR